jgi:hypothetical protein
MSDAPLDFPNPPATPIISPAALADCGESPPLPVGKPDNEQLSVCAAFWAY